MKEPGKYSVFIGVDVGVNTGIAIYMKESKLFSLVSSCKIHEAMEIVKKNYAAYGGSLFVRFEDARLRKWFGHSGREKLQGAGSVKRDSKIWEDFLNDLGISFEMVAPSQNTTKLTSLKFKRITGYKLKTNEHGRDAAMLVYGY